MQVDFAARAHRAYDAIAVPPLPLQPIRVRVARHARRQRAVIAALCTVVLALSIGFASGAGAALTSQIRIWFSGGRMSVDVRGLAMTTWPTHAVLVDLTRRATFPVVLPVGLPSGARLMRVGSSPADHPSTITLIYALPRGGLFGITLVDPTSVESSAPPALAPSTPATAWTVQGERVFVNAQPQYAAVARIVRARMQDATAASALAASDANTVHGIALNAHQLAQIPKLARDGAPLYDNRTVVLTKIPRVNGEPDYRHATLTWPRQLALSPSAVREVSAYLQAHPTLTHGQLLYVPGLPKGRRIQVLRMP